MMVGYGSGAAAGFNSAPARPNRLGSISYIVPRFRRERVSLLLCARLLAAEVGHRVTAQAINVIGGDGFHEFRIVFYIFHGTLTYPRREVPSNATAARSAFPAVRSAVLFELDHDLIGHDGLRRGGVSA